MSALKLPPRQREQGTGPNPSGERAPVTKSVPRAPKAEQAPVAAQPAAEVVASAQVANPEAAAAQPEPKKKKSASKKKTATTAAPASATTLAEPTAAPEATPATPAAVSPDPTPTLASTPDAAPAAATAPPEAAATAAAPTTPTESTPATPPAPARRSLTLPPRVTGTSLPPPSRTETAPAATAAATTETAPASPPTPPASEAKKGFFDSITSGFRSAADRFMARFRGEVTAQDERDYKPTSMDVAASIAAGTISVVASYTGIKIIADLPEWLTQKYFTSQERSRIKAALKAKETELGADYGSPAAFDAKKAKLEEAIRVSKFLTKEKKAKLIQDLKGVIDTRDYALVEAKNKRDQHIAKLLDEAIQSRIKNTQILKETLNSALMVTGLSALRGAGYGAVALWERRERLVKDENLMRQKTARGLDPKVKFFNDLIIGGMQDTWKQLKGGGAETKAGKAVNFVQGFTTVMRAAGFAELAISEIQQEGVTGMIEASLKAWEAKGTGQTITDNMAAPWERLGSLFGRTSNAAINAPESSPGSDADTGDSGADTSDAGADSGAAETSPTESSNAGSTSTEAGAVAPAYETVEYPESVIETGTVHKGDGIIEILQRQGLSAREALAAARETGIVRPGGDTRLSTESIGRISILVHETDGHQVIEFHDAQTGNTLSLDEARAQGFTYEHGSGSSAISEPAVAAHEASDTPEPEVGESTEVPHTLVGGKITLNPIEGGFNVDTDPSSVAFNQVHGMGDLDTIGANGEAEIVAEQTQIPITSQRLVSEMAILEKLEKQGLGESPEAHFIRMNLKSDLFVAEHSYGFKPEELAKIEAEAQKYDVDKILAVPEADRINDIRIPGLGKVEFDYDASGNPSFNLDQLIQNAKPTLELRAQNMLVENWQESVTANYILDQEMQIAGPVYLMNEALKELKSSGHENSAESTFLKQQLAEYLRAKADVLDGNNSIVKEAAEKAGVYTEIFTNS